MRRLRIEAPAGFVADEPVGALEALVAIVESEGVDSDDWLVKALRGRGVKRIGVPVSREPRFRVIEGTVSEAHKRYSSCITAMNQAIAERLEQAARDAKKQAKKKYATKRG